MVLLFAVVPPCYWFLVLVCTLVLLTLGVFHCLQFALVYWFCFTVVRAHLCTEPRLLNQRLCVWSQALIPE